MIGNTDLSLQSNEIPLIIPVIKEGLHVEKIIEETGSVKIRKTVLAEEVPYSVSLQTERLETRTIPFNTWIKEHVPAVRQEGDTTIISVTKEVLIVEKRIMLVEEIHIVRIKESHLETGSESVRVEKVDVSRSSKN